MLDAVKDEREKYVRELTVLLGHGHLTRYTGFIHSVIFSCMTAPPRLHVIAALKALGRWPSDWSSE